MRILNLGCGVKTSSRPEVINVDWSVYLVAKRHRLWRLIVPLFIEGERLRKWHSLPDNVMVHNLAKGIPFGFESADVVYHSHLLEHLDRDLAKRFLLEVKRVLKPGGVQRIVVPDLERVCRAYISHISLCEADPGESNHHDAYVAALLEQSVRREGYGASKQKPFRRFVENIVLGDARQRGETHQWMYDRINLRTTLVNQGYRKVAHQEYNTSLISHWNEYGLDLNEHGDQYLSGSLYIEAVK